jgi:predicted kinase
VACRVKSTLARQLAQELGAVYLRIDTIERAIADGDAAAGVDAKGYRVAYAVAEDNLGLGRTVIGDCVNPLHITRDAWRSIAERAAVTAVEIEVICSDPHEHRRQIETRLTDSPVTWDEVVTRNYEPWSGKSNLYRHRQGGHCSKLCDLAATAAQAIAALVAFASFCFVAELAHSVSGSCRRR